MNEQNNYCIVYHVYQMICHPLNLFQMVETLDITNPPVIPGKKKVFGTRKSLTSGDAWGVQTLMIFTRYD